MRLMFSETMKILSAGFGILLAIATTGVANAQSGWGPPVELPKEAAVSFKLLQQVTNPPNTVYWISITGSITADTPNKVSTAIAKLKELGRIAVPPTVKDEPIFGVQIWSNGGNVDAAIAIGRMLRDVHATVVVEDGLQCLSSCVLVIAGGTTRAMFGRIGIHRPYLETPNKSPTSAEVSVAMAHLREKIVSYLSTMNVDRTLADDMMKTRPENIRYLTPSDLQHYGLLERDPFSEETAALKEASKYGLSRAEYMKRKAGVLEVCRGLFDNLDCRDEVLSGKR